jgi:ankyrin repeat protein
LDLLLLNRDLKLNVQGGGGRTLLHQAIKLKYYPQKQLIQLITRLLAAGADCNAIDEQGNTPLIQACQLKQEEIVMLLLEQPSIDIHPSNNQMSALIYAVKAGVLTIVEKLLTHDIDIADRIFAFNLALQNKKEKMATLLLQTAQDQQDFINQALTQVITNDSPSLAYKLIKDYTANPNVTDAAGFSALTLALKGKYPLLFDLLLNHPDFIIDISKNKEEKTVLHYILHEEGYSYKQLIQLTHLFIKEGGNCNTADEEGNTPLILACQANRKAVVELLLQQPYLNINARNNIGNSALKYAVKHGTVAMVQTLLQYEIELDNQLAAFNYAIQSKKNEMITLLKESLSPDLTNQALSWALKKGQKADDYSATNYSFLIRQLTEQHGANPEQVANFYPSAFRIALCEAVQQKSRDSMALLDKVLGLPNLKLPIDKDYHGNTPLMYAVKLQKYPQDKITQLIKRLFDLGVEVNASNEEGHTALMLACGSNPKLIPLLLEQPAININIKSEQGKSALEWAINKNDATILTDLLKYDIDPATLVDAFNYALTFTLNEIVKLLWQTVEQKRIGIEQVFIRALAEKRFKASSIISKLIDEYGADPDTVDEYGTSALNIALKEGAGSLIDKIVQQPDFKINVAKDPAGNTALIYALELINYPKEKQIHLVKRLLEYGADYNVIDEKGDTALLLVCKNKKETLAHLLLQQPLIDVNIRDKKDKSALDYAIEYDMVSVVQALLNHQLTVECHLSAFNYAIELKKNNLIKLIWQKAEDKEKFINQALSWAIEKAQSEAALSVIYTLIKEYGADPNTVDKAELSPLAIALRRQDTALLDILLQHPKLKINIQTKSETGGTLLHWALALKAYPFAKRILLIERLFAHEIDCNAADEKGFTPLMVLANQYEYDGKKLLPLLLQQTLINTNAKTTEGFSALDYAVHCSSGGFVQALLKYGVNTNTLLGASNLALEHDKNEMIRMLWPDVKRQREFNNQALSIAISQNYAQAAYKLIKVYKADPNTMDNLGFSALNVALRKQYIPLLDRLLSCSDFKISLEKDYTGNTALMGALALDFYTEEKRIPLVKYLLASGADYNFVDPGGKTPLILTCGTNQFELTNLLLQYAPNINARDNEGNSALDYAVLYGTVNLIQVLLTYEVAPDSLLSAFNQAVHFEEDSMAEILLEHAKRQGNEQFVHQALARAIDKGQQKVISILRMRYGAG